MCLRKGDLLTPDDGTALVALCPPRAHAASVAVVAVGGASLSPRIAPTPISLAASFFSVFFGASRPPHTLPPMTSMIALGNGHFAIGSFHTQLDDRSIPCFHLV